MLSTLLHPTAPPHRPADRWALRGLVALVLALLLPLQALAQCRACATEACDEERRTSTAVRSTSETAASPGAISTPADDPLPPCHASLPAPSAHDADALTTDPAPNDAAMSCCFDDDAARLAEAVSTTTVQGLEGALELAKVEPTVVIAPSNSPARTKPPDGAPTPLFTLYASLLI